MKHGLLITLVLLGAFLITSCAGGSQPPEGAQAEELDTITEDEFRSHASSACAGAIGFWNSDEGETVDVPDIPSKGYDLCEEALVSFGYVSEGNYLWPDESGYVEGSTPSHAHLAADDVADALSEWVIPAKAGPFIEMFKPYLDTNTP
jgi:hypothetical protein